MDARELLGKGVYSISEVARISKIDPRRIRRWVIGYDANGKTFPPVMYSPVLKMDDTEILTFLQLIEVLYIKEFYEVGIHLPVIRKIGKNAAKEYKTNYPFAYNAEKRKTLRQGGFMFNLTTAKPP